LKKKPSQVAQADTPRPRSRVSLSSPSHSAEAPVATTEAEGTAETDVLTDEDDDELLLGSDDILTAPVGAPPINPPEDEDEAEQPTASSGGGTLFERMSNIARGAPKAQIEDDESGINSDPIDIPRFLNRQNNQ
jgi:cell division protein FtsZ